LHPYEFSFSFNNYVHLSGVLAKSDAMISALAKQWDFVGYLAILPSFCDIITCKGSQASTE
jgi:hypothetical protein